MDNIRKVVGHDDYYITKDGLVYKMNNHGKLKEVSLSKTKYGIVKFNVTVNGKSFTKILSLEVYKAFKGRSPKDIQYIDGNKENCSLNNLITTEELLKFYKSKML